jgi:hypothetical protein
VQFTLPLAELLPASGCTYESTRALLTSGAPGAQWAAYAAGCLVVLALEKGTTFSGGVSIYIHSEVPFGKGVSSSASIEVAVMAALAAAVGVSLERRELAILCQMVENKVIRRALLRAGETGASRWPLAPSARLLTHCSLLVLAAYCTAGSARLLCLQGCTLHSPCAAISAPPPPSPSFPFLH